MSFEEKNLNLIQCVEGGFTFGENFNPVENLINGLEADPDWFNFSVSKKDYELLAEIYAGVLADYVSYSVDDTVYQILHGISIHEGIKIFILNTYHEGLPCSEADINNMLEDSISQMTRNFDTSEFREVESSNIEDFVENAEFGTKSYIDDNYYYKVRNQVNYEPYTIYFDENDGMKIL